MGCSSVVPDKRGALDSPVVPNAIFAKVLILVERERALIKSTLRLEALHGFFTIACTIHLGEQPEYFLQMLLFGTLRLLISSLGSSWRLLAQFDPKMDPKIGPKLIQKLFNSGVLHFWIPFFGGFGALWVPLGSPLGPPEALLGGLWTPKTFKNL